MDISYLEKIETESPIDEVGGESICYRTALCRNQLVNQEMQSLSMEAAPSYAKARTACMPVLHLPVELPAGRMRLTTISSSRNTI